MHNPKLAGRLQRIRVPSLVFWGPPGSGKTTLARLIAEGTRAQFVPYVISPRGMLVPELIRRKSRWVKAAWIALVERANLEAAWERLRARLEKLNHVPKRRKATKPTRGSQERRIEAKKQRGQLKKQRRNWD